MNINYISYFICTNSTYRWQKNSVLYLWPSRDVILMQYWLITNNDTIIKSCVVTLIQPVGKKNNPKIHKPLGGIISKTNLTKVKFQTHFKISNSEWTKLVKKLCNLHHKHSARENKFTIVSSFITSFLDKYAPNWKTKHTIGLSEPKSPHIRCHSTISSEIFPMQEVNI